MSDVLSQSQIDMLLNSMREGNSGAAKQEEKKEKEARMSLDNILDIVSCYFGRSGSGGSGIQKKASRRGGQASHPESALSRNERKGRGC